MNECAIYYDDRVVGKAVFTKQGMYAIVSCACKIPQDHGYNAFVVMTDTTIPLGMLVPTGNEMCTQKRVHLKKLTGGIICISVSKRSSAAGIFVEPNKPFQYISKIEMLKVVINGDSGELSLIIT